MKKYNERTSFKMVEELNGCKTFKELEEESDDKIFYADGCCEPVIEAMDNEPHVDVVSYSFDGWYVAMLKY